MMLLGSKVDCIDERRVSLKSIKFHTEYSAPYYEVSSKNLYNHDKPLLDLLRLLAKDPLLTFVEFHSQKEEISPEQTQLD